MLRALQIVHHMRDVDFTGLQPFVLDPRVQDDDDTFEYDGETDTFKGIEHDVEIDFPFPIFSMEPTEGALMTFVVGGSMPVGDSPLGQSVEIHIKALVAFDYGPGDHAFGILCDGFAANGAYEKNVVMAIMSPKHAPDDVPMLSLWRGLTEQSQRILGRMRNCEVGEFQAKGKAKYRDENGVKRTYEPRRVVYVAPKREREARVPKGIEVNWTHSWHVMGHWRKVRGVGKDRYGEYNQPGRTWVKPFVKGDGELLDKTRIVQ